MTALVPPGVKVHLALGYIDMRKGLDGLAMLMQGVLRQDPFTSSIWVSSNCLSVSTIRSKASQLRAAHPMPP